MKNVIVFVFVFAVISAAAIHAKVWSLKKSVLCAFLLAAGASAFAGTPTSNTEHMSMSHSSNAGHSMQSSASPAYESIKASASSEMPSTSMAKSEGMSARGFADSRSESMSKNIKRASLPQMTTSQAGATKTRCITRVRGNVEEKVCQYSTMSMDDANAYFAMAEAEARAAKTSK